MHHDIHPFLTPTDIAPPGPMTPLGYTLNLESEHPYFAERKITARTAKTFELGFSRCKPLKNRIAIPVHDAKGVLIGYAGRWPGQTPEKTSKYLFVGDLNRALFNLHRVINLDDPQDIVIVTGFFDVMRLWQLRHYKVIGLLGTELTLARIKLLLHYFPGHKFCILFDADRREAAEQAAMKLGQFAYVRVPVFRSDTQRVDQLK